MNPKVFEQTPAFPLRLELAGVGQLASPLQGTWIVSNIQFQVAAQGLIESSIHPRHVIAELCRELLQVRDTIWSTQVATQYMDIFGVEIEAVDRPIVFASFSQDEEPELTLTQEIAQAVQAEEASIHLKDGQPAAICPTMPAEPLSALNPPKTNPGGGGGGGGVRFATRPIQHP